MQIFKPFNFIFFSVIPFLGLFFLYAYKRKKKILHAFISKACIAKNINSASKVKQLIKYILYILAIAFLIIALARPQWGAEKKKLEKRGLDILFLLDTSASMNAQDIKPSRFERSKMNISKMLKAFNGDRVGLVPFAGAGYLYCPLTLDYSAFKLFLDSVNIDFVPIRGTDYAEAIVCALNSFYDSESKYNVIVIFSDGEDHSGKIGKIITKLKDLKIRVYSIGMATHTGAQIPIYDKKGNFISFKLDKSGNQVITRLNEGNLKKISTATGGKYFPYSPNGKELSIILDLISKMEKKDLDERIMIEKEEKFAPFLFGSLLLLLLEFFLTDYKVASPRRV